MYLLSLTSSYHNESVNLCVSQKENYLKRVIDRIIEEYAGYKKEETKIYDALDIKYKPRTGQKRTEEEILEMREKLNKLENCGYFPLLLKLNLFNKLEIADKSQYKIEELPEY